MVKTAPGETRIGKMSFYKQGYRFKFLAPDKNVNAVNKLFIDRLS